MKWILILAAGGLMLGADVVGFLDEAASIPAYGMILAISLTQLF